MRIEYLADYPELVPVIAQWHHDQWSYMNPGRSISERISEYRKQHGRRQIPTPVVALVEDQPVGSASLIKHDMDTHEELTPWLASVFVSPQHRGRGIGSSLVQRIEKEAESLGIEVLYLFTPDQESLYARLQWKVLFHEEYKGERVVVMKKRLQ
jgi:N-acetylglutamate synthase-like GNAT family acetyltransferase